MFCLLWLSAGAFNTALAQPSRVVVLTPSEPLTRALTQSLAAWDVHIEAVHGDNPGATMPASSMEGRRLAVQHDARAVVWISESESGFALWVFDSQGDRVLARPLPSGPPFDEPTAAQVALVVKTFLRSTEFAREPSPAVSSAVSSAVSPTRDATETDEPDASLGWDLLLATGVRGYTTAPASPDVRVLLGVTVWPRNLQRAFGVSLLVESGPGLRSTNSALDARWTDTSLMIALRGRLRLGSHFDLGGTLGVGVRLTTLHGETNSGAEVARQRITPHGRLELELGVHLTSSLRLELRGGTTLSGVVQRYFVGEVLALDVRRASVHALLGLEVRIR